MNTYYIKQKISSNDKYYVYDDNNKPYLKIMSNNKLLTFIDRLFGGIFSFGNTLYIKSIDEDELITIKKKFGFFKNEYDLYNKKDKIASIKQHIMSINPKISIVTKDDDYLITGDLLGISFTISKNDIDIAQVKKVMFTFMDSYKIDIFEDKDALICLSILIVIDNSIHN